MHGQVRAEPVRQAPGMVRQLPPGRLPLCSAGRDGPPGELREARVGHQLVREVRRTVRQGLLDDVADLRGQRVPRPRRRLPGERRVQQPPVRAVGRQGERGEVRGQEAVRRLAGRGRAGDGGPRGDPGDVQPVVRRQPVGAVPGGQVPRVPGERLQDGVQPAVDVRRVAEHGVLEAVDVQALVVLGDVAVQVVAEDVDERAVTGGQPPADHRLEQRAVPPGQRDGPPAREQRLHAPQRTGGHKHAAGGEEPLPFGVVLRQDHRRARVDPADRPVDRGHQVRHRDGAGGHGELVPAGAGQRIGEPAYRGPHLGIPREGPADGALVRRGGVLPGGTVQAAVARRLARVGQPGRGRRRTGIRREVLTVRQPLGRRAVVLAPQEELRAAARCLGSPRHDRGGARDGVDARRVRVGHLLGDGHHALGAPARRAGEHQLPGAPAQAEFPEPPGGPASDQRPADVLGALGRQHAQRADSAMRAPDEPCGLAVAAQARREGQAVRPARGGARGVADGGVRDVQQVRVAARADPPVRAGEAGLAEDDPAGRRDLPGDDLPVPRPVRGPLVLHQDDVPVLQAGRQVADDRRAADDREVAAVREDHLVPGRAREGRELVRPVRVDHLVQHRMAGRVPGRLLGQPLHGALPVRPGLGQPGTADGVSLGRVRVRAVQRAGREVTPVDGALGLRQQRRGPDRHLRVHTQLGDQPVGRQRGGDLAQPRAGPLPGMLDQPPHRRIPPHHQRQRGSVRALAEAGEPGVDPLAERGAARLAARQDPLVHQLGVGAAEQEQRRAVAGRQVGRAAPVGARPPAEGVPAFGEGAVGRGGAVHAVRHVVVEVRDGAATGVLRGHQGGRPLGVPDLVRQPLQCLGELLVAGERAPFELLERVEQERHQAVQLGRVGLHRGGGAQVRLQHPRAVLLERPGPLGRAQQLRQTRCPVLRQHPAEHRVAESDPGLGGSAQVVVDPQERLGLPDALRGRADGVAQSGQPRVETGGGGRRRQSAVPGVDGRGQREGLHHVGQRRGVVAVPQRPQRAEVVERRRVRRGEEVPPVRGLGVQLPHQLLERGLRGDPPVRVGGQHLADGLLEAAGHLVPAGPVVAVQHVGHRCGDAGGPGGGLLRRARRGGPREGVGARQRGDRGLGGGDDGSHRGQCPVRIGLRPLDGAQQFVGVAVAVGAHLAGGDEQVDRLRVADLAPAWVVCQGGEFAGGGLRYLHDDPACRVRRELRQCQGLVRLDLLEFRDAQLQQAGAGSRDGGLHRVVHRPLDGGQLGQALDGQAQVHRDLEAQIGGELGGLVQHLLPQRTEFGAVRRGGGESLAQAPQHRVAQQQREPDRAAVPGRVHGPLDLRPHQRFQPCHALGEGEFIGTRLQERAAVRVAEQVQPDDVGGVEAVRRQLPSVTGPVAGRGVPGRPAVRAQSLFGAGRDGGRLPGGGEQPDRLRQAVRHLDAVRLVGEPRHALGVHPPVRRAKALGEVAGRKSVAGREDGVGQAVQVHAVAGQRRGQGRLVGARPGEVKVRQEGGERVLPGQAPAEHRPHERREPLGGQAEIPVEQVHRAGARQRVPVHQDAAAVGQVAARVVADAPQRGEGGVGVVRGVEHHAGQLVEGRLRPEGVEAHLVAAGVGQRPDDPAHDRERGRVLGQPLAQGLVVDVRAREPLRSARRVARRLAGEVGLRRGRRARRLHVVRHHPQERRAGRPPAGAEQHVVGGPSVDADRGVPRVRLPLRWVLGDRLLRQRRQPGALGSHRTRPLQQRRGVRHPRLDQPPDRLHSALRAADEPVAVAAHHGHRVRRSMGGADDEAGLAGARVHPLGQRPGPGRADGLVRRVLDPVVLDVREVRVGPRPDGVVAEGVAGEAEPRAGGRDHRPCQDGVVPGDPRRRPRNLDGGDVRVPQAGLPVPGVTVSPLPQRDRLGGHHTAPGRRQRVERGLPGRQRPQHLEDHRMPGARLRGPQLGVQLPQRHRAVGGAGVEGGERHVPLGRVRLRAAEQRARRQRGVEGRAVAGQPGRQQLQCLGGHRGVTAHLVQQPVVGPSGETGDRRRHLGRGRGPPDDVLDVGVAQHQQRPGRPVLGVGLAAGGDDQLPQPVQRLRAVPEHPRLEEPRVGSGGQRQRHGVRGGHLFQHVQGDGVAQQLPQRRTALLPQRRHGAGARQLAQPPGEDELGGGPVPHSGDRVVEHRQGPPAVQQRVRRLLQGLPYRRVARQSTVRQASPRVQVAVDPAVHPGQVGQPRIGLHRPVPDTRGVRDIQEPLPGQGVLAGEVPPGHRVAEQEHVVVRHPQVPVDAQHLLDVPGLLLLMGRQVTGALVPAPPHLVVPGPGTRAHTPRSGQPGGPRVVRHRPGERAHQLVERRGVAPVQQAPLGRGHVEARQRGAAVQQLQEAVGRPAGRCPDVRHQFRQARLRLGTDQRVGRQRPGRRTPVLVRQLQVPGPRRPGEELREPRLVEGRERRRSRRGGCGGLLTGGRGRGHGHGRGCLRGRRRCLERRGTGVQVDHRTGVAADDEGPVAVRIGGLRRGGWRVGRSLADGRGGRPGARQRRGLGAGPVIRGARPGRVDGQQEDVAPRRAVVRHRDRVRGGQRGPGGALPGGQRPAQCGTGRAAPRVGHHDGRRQRAGQQRLIAPQQRDDVLVGHPQRSAAGPGDLDVVPVAVDHQDVRVRGRPRAPPGGAFLAARGRAVRRDPVDVRGQRALQRTPGEVAAHHGTGGRDDRGGRGEQALPLEVEGGHLDGVEHVTAPQRRRRHQPQRRLPGRRRHRPRQVQHPGDQRVRLRMALDGLHGLRHRPEQPRPHLLARGGQGLQPDGRQNLRSDPREGGRGVVEVGQRDEVVQGYGA